MMMMMMMMLSQSWSPFWRQFTVKYQKLSWWLALQRWYRYWQRLWRAGALLLTAGWHTRHPKDRAHVWGHGLRLCWGGEGTEGQTVTKSLLDLSFCVEVHRTLPNSDDEDLLRYIKIHEKINQPVALYYLEWLQLKFKMFWVWIPVWQYLKLVTFSRSF